MRSTKSACLAGGLQDGDGELRGDIAHVFVFTKSKAGCERLAKT